MLIAFTLIVAAADAQSLPLKWAGSAGASGDDWPRSIAVDDSGNVYTIGTFSGTVDFDPGPGTYNLTSAFNTIDPFLTKTDSSGNLKWAVTWGGSQINSGVRVLLDTAGDIWAIGAFFGSADFDPGPGNNSLNTGGSVDTYILKLDNNGGFKWVKSFESTYDVSPSDAVWDPFGNLLVSGNFQDSADFDPGSGIYMLGSPGQRNAFVCKLDASANLVWAGEFGSKIAMPVAAHDFGYAVATDAAGNVYVSGTFTRTGDFDPGPGVFALSADTSKSLTNSDVFLVKLNPSGAFQWAGALNGPAFDRVYAMTSDAAGQVYLTGVFGDSVDFDPGAGMHLLTSGGASSLAYDAFVASYAATGNFMWASGFSSAGYVLGFSLDRDAAGNLWTCGSFTGVADFDPGAGTNNLTSNGDADMYICKLDGGGNLLDAVSMGGTGKDLISAIRQHNSGLLYVGGYISGSVDMDPGPGTATLTSAGGWDIVNAAYRTGGPLGETEPAALGSLFVFPNPARNGQITVSWPESGGVVRADWITPAGQVVRRVRLLGPGFLEIPGNRRGVYFLRLSAGDKVRMVKVVSL